MSGPTTVAELLEAAADITGRVARGAALLDEEWPGWDRGIDLNTLDLSSSCRCILGQTWDEPYGPTDKDAAYCEQVRRLFGRVVHFRDEISHGFNADADAEFPALTSEWRRVILARRDSEAGVSK